MLKTFLNAWWIAVKISHNKEMEYLNNPTPEVVYDLTDGKNRLRRLHKWASNRWGNDRVANEIIKKSKQAVEAAS